MTCSRGIKIYGTYALVFGCINLAGNLALAVFLVGRGTAAPVSPLKPMVGALINVVFVAAGIGVFLLKPWGRLAAMGVAVCALALALLNVRHIPTSMAMAQQIGFVSGYLVFPLILNLGLLWFFTRPTVIAQFQKP